MSNIIRTSSIISDPFKLFSPYDESEEKSKIEVGLGELKKSESYSDHPLEEESLPASFDSESSIATTEEKSHLLSSSESRSVEDTSLDDENEAPLQNAAEVDELRALIEKTIPESKGHRVLSPTPRQSNSINFKEFESALETHDESL